MQIGAFANTALKILVFVEAFANFALANLASENRTATDSSIAKLILVHLAFLFQALANLAFANSASAPFFANLVLANKGIIVGYACIIDRSNGKTSIKNKIVSQIKLDIPTYSGKDLPDDLSAIKAIKPGSRNLK